MHTQQQFLPKTSPKKKRRRKSSSTQFGNTFHIAYFCAISFEPNGINHLNNAYPPAISTDDQTPKRRPERKSSSTQFGNTFHIAYFCAISSERAQPFPNGLTGSRSELENLGPRVATSENLIKQTVCVIA
ncbi:hypothetical protein CEXT_390781 [Caerostris extrusa]|uniref:Uncharacterized protein n=1 Tax=Caerostris extrusa TaxID=172846 RepID=A0AAV4W943_CAEEX|nr:hypothetical protein CEXT_390781 [Caerostris extrusa]